MNQGGVPTGTLNLRALTDKHYAALVDELNAHLDSELKAARERTAAEVSAEVTAKERLHAESQIELAREESSRETRVATAESLNQVIRRIRETSDPYEALGILLESTAVYADQAVVLKVENNHAEVLGGRGIEECEFEIPLDQAAAIADVCETRDPLVALVSEPELSDDLFHVLSKPDDPERKAYLFPIVARHEVMAVLIVCGDDPVPAAIEMLSEATGMKIEALEQHGAAEMKPLSSPGLVQIAQPSVPEAHAGDPLSWADLSPEDQKLHLQAQRVARVKVAEIRLYQPDQLRKGVFESNIYGALGNEIDRLRAEFLQTFLTKSQTMVDYLHLELVRSLAHDDDKLLGPTYPGPMV